MELKQFITVILKKWWLVVIVVLLFSTATGLYTNYFMTPIYKASSKIIVNKSIMDSSGNPTVDVNAINTNIMLINSYKEIITSQRIMNKVVEDNPELNLNTIDLLENVKVVLVDNSQIVTLQITDSSHDRAVNTINAIAKTFQEEVPKIMSVDNITILDAAQASQNAVPISPSLVVNLLIAVVAALMVSVGLIFLIEYLDDSIKTDADVERLLELNTLGVITKIRKSDLQTKEVAASTKKVGETYVTASQ